MKKTFLLTVLILSIVLGATAFAATETQKPEIKADTFWNNGNNITKSGAATFVAGTLPSEDTAGFMRNYSSVGVGRFPRFQCYGTGYLDDNADNVDDDGIVYASAARESEDSTNTEAYSNIVFNLQGDGQTILNDTVFSDAELAYTGKHSIRFKYSSDVSDNGVISLFVLSGLGANSVHRETLQDSGVGVFVSNGGAYIHNAITDEMEWFIQPGELSADTWYTAETLVEIVNDGYIVQNAWIKDRTGAVVGNSGCYNVSTKKASDYTQGAAANKFNLLQLGTKNLGIGTVMLDDWKTYAVTGTPARGTSALTFVQDTDKAKRQTYKFETGIVLDSAGINNDLVTVTCVSDPTLNLRGKYTVTCDNTAIVVTMRESLPMDTKFKMEIDADKFLETTDGYVAFDYSSPAVTASMSKEFITPALSEIFTTSFSGNTPSSTITLSNGDVVEHEYMIVASLVRAGKYLETAATHGTLAARDAMTSAPTVSSALPIPTFTETPVSGDKIMIMVWDNWKDMNSYTNTNPEEIAVP